MNRELNPRAWSIDGECWCTRVDYDGYKKEWSGIAPVFAPDNRSKYIGEIEDTNIIVEFPTGFKDKNGKEIYDGDIIVDFDEFISAVDGSCAVISEKTCHEKYFDEDDCSLERRTRPLIRVVNDYGYYPEKKETQVEVVGNIHENPELIGEKQ